MDRRTFIMGMGLLALSQGMTACTGANARTLRVRILKNSIPPQILNRFRQELRRSSPGSFHLDFTPVPELPGLFSLLEAWKPAPKGEPRSGFPFPIPFQNTRRPQVADLVTLGDYWLTRAIQQQLIQPLELEKLSGWKALPTEWQRLVTRDRQGQLTTSGQVWGAPYRWGMTVMAYRRDVFQKKGWEPPQDWGDLWRPELKGQISLLESAREVIGLTLKMLGDSYNSPKPLSSVPGLNTELKALHNQARFYSSTNYLQPLLLKDTAVAVGWSLDLIPLLQTSRHIGIVVPTSGTALWSDLWVRPVAASTTSATEDLLEAWIDFCWQAPIAQSLSILSRAASPVVVGSDRATLPAELQNNGLILPSQALLQKCEFLHPLSASALQEYRQTWEAIRSGARLT
ncbi:MAG: extracellular solute-binding protein [Leptolyngbyaceae cyanobacterium bins.59]|nr:extracellular solute-binding protein [Leptolyngbyaceae cyanobacterium bins.59]